MKFRNIICGIVVFLSISGCSSVGNEKLRKETDSSIKAKMTEGRTTKAEVKAIFGAPANVTFTDGGLEIWTYEFARASADAISYIPIVGILSSSSSGKKKELVVLFDEAGIIKKFTMNESDIKAKMGILN